MGVTESWLLGKDKTNLVMMMLGLVSSGIEVMKVGSVLVSNGMEVLSQKLLSCTVELFP